MLTYRINAKQTDQRELIPLTKQEKKRYVVGGADHKQAILRHALKNTYFKEGDTVYAYDGEEGTIVDICPHYDKIEWNGLKPLFIGVWIEDYQCSLYFHYSDLEWTK